MQESGPPNNNPELDNRLDEGPQLVGLINESDKQSALQDPRSLIVEIAGEQVPLICPVRHNSEVNAAYFSDLENAFFFDASKISSVGDTAQAHDFVKSLPRGTKILIEQREGHEDAAGAMLGSLHADGREAVLDPDCIDEFNATLAAVHHYYSPIDWAQDPKAVDSFHGTPALLSMRDSHKALVANGAWETWAQRGIEFINGQDISVELLDALWDVYDRTFDVLVSNHPSAQKQLKNDFLAQCRLPESNITYAMDEDGVCSALFLIDDIKKCTWLKDSFFTEINPSGDTVFVPGISTKLSKKGMAFSPLIIGAMADITRLVPSITGFATQCTNRSADYIPKIAQESTEGTANLRFQETAVYQYPVITI